MLKQTIEYTDFDDNKAAETVYFNLTKSELADNIHLHDELQALKDTLNGDKRSLVTSEIKQILDLVKTFMKLSYGVRSADGKRFIKTEEQWTEFTQTATYDAFLFSLFEFPERAMAFMTGILPADMRDSAKAAANREMLQAATSKKFVGEDKDMGNTKETSVGPQVIDVPMDVDSQPKEEKNVKESVVSSEPVTLKALEEMTAAEFAEWQKTKRGQ